MADLPTPPDSAGTSPFAVNELETALRGPDGKAKADQLIARINELINRIETYKNSGLSTDDYSRVDSINKSLAIARDIVLRISRINHTRGVHP